MRTPEEYEIALRTCTLCTAYLATKPVDPANSEEIVVPRPIVRPLTPKPIMVIGQAPGLTEYRSGKPFSGPAGKALRNLFQECGCDPESFDRFVFTSAVAKCFPGSELRNGSLRRADLKPSDTMLTNCRPFLLAQITMVSPQVIVLFGKMALEVYVEIRIGKKSKIRLEDFVGRV